MVVLVTGAKGQLGQAIASIAKNYAEIDFVFCSSAELDISNLDHCKAVFNTHRPNYCINAAAYTAVDKAESEPEKGHLINVVGARNLANVCKEFSATLLHVSTDFVFDGGKNSPYAEEDIPNPTGVYGQTKLDGEKAIQDTFDDYFIIRTSWVYSQFGNNFMKTMLRLASERDALSVVNDQIGTPTNAVDLAKVLLHIITFSISVPPSGVRGLFGIYHFSNEGTASWYDFAKKIFEINNIKIDLRPIPTTDFPTPAKRPKYSVLDKSKIKKNFDIQINNWENSIPKMY